MLVSRTAITGPTAPRLSAHMNTPNAEMPSNPLTTERRLARARSAYIETPLIFVATGSSTAEVSSTTHTVKPSQSPLSLVPWASTTA